MLDVFLEKNIQNKLELYHILKASTAVDVKEILTATNASEYNVRNLLEELAYDFKDLAEIKRSSQYYSLYVYKGVNALKLLHAIYRDSLILQCLKFFIRNEGRTYTAFIQDTFVSKSEAYRIKNRCEEYLKTIGLKVVDNKIAGEEYRIRFLIALLYYKYGINCCDIDEEDIRLARKFVLATNQAVNQEFLERAANEYGYFECLLILSWKRKSYPVFSKNSAETSRSFAYINYLKKIFIYSEMVDYVRDNLAQPLNVCFSEWDYTYIYLAYLCTNSCVLADKWTSDDINQLYQIVLSQEIFGDLCDKMKQKFGKTVAQNRAMKRVLLYFYKKCFFKLHCIIPDKAFYFDTVRNPLTRELICQVTEMLDTWRVDNDLTYPFEEGHIRYLSIQIESVMRQTMEAVHVVVASDIFSELEVMKLILRKKYSSQRILVEEFLINAWDVGTLYKLENCIILVNHKFENVMEHIDISKSNMIVLVTSEMNSFDMNKIEKAIKQYEEVLFLQLVGANSIRR